MHGKCSINHSCSVAIALPVILAHPYLWLEVRIVERAIRGKRVDGQGVQGEGRQLLLLSNPHETRWPDPHGQIKLEFCGPALWLVITLLLTGQISFLTGLNRVSPKFMPTL